MQTFINRVNATLPFVLKRHDHGPRPVHAKIVKLLRARKLTMADIGDMVGPIALIAKAHGASPGIRRFDPLKVRKAIRLIDRGMQESHAAQIVGRRADSLMRHLEKRGLYERQTGRHQRWTDRQHENEA